MYYFIMEVSMMYIVDNSMLDFESWGASTEILNKIFAHLKENPMISNQLDEIMEEYFKGKDLPTDVEVHQCLVDHQQEIMEKLGL